MFDEVNSDNAHVPGPLPLDLNPIDAPCIYRLGWILRDVGGFVRQFRAPQQFTPYEQELESTTSDLELSAA